MSNQNANKISDIMERIVLEEFTLERFADVLKKSAPNISKVEIGCSLEKQNEICLMWRNHLLRKLAALNGEPISEEELRTVCNQEIEKLTVN